MKQLTKKTKAICLILAVIIIAGIIVISTVGFNVELSMKKNDKVDLYIEKDFDVSDIINITSEIFQDDTVIIRKIDVFEDAVSVIAKEITEEQKQQLISRINEKYSIELKAESTNIEEVPNERIRDLINPYIFTFGLSSVLILVYMILRYKKIGMLKVFLKTLATIVISEVILFCTIAIVRIPVGRLTIPMTISVYLATLFILTHRFENSLAELKEKEEK